MLKYTAFAIDLIRYKFIYLIYSQKAYQTSGQLSPQKIAKWEWKHFILFKLGLTKRKFVKQNFIYTHGLTKVVSNEPRIFNFKFAG